MSDWIKWDGGMSPPSPETKVDVRLRNGHEMLHSSALNWSVTGDPFDIVEYRFSHAAVTPNAATLVLNGLSAFNPLGAQVGGDHYKKLKIQPIEYIHGNNIPFAEGCVIKYVSRWRGKGGIKDLEKAKHFLDMLIELESKNVTAQA